MVFKPIAEIKKTWKEIPAEVQRFLKRALIVFVVWKLLYTLILFPSNIPDKQLRNATSWGTVQLLKWKFPESVYKINYLKRVNPVNNYLMSFDDITKDGRKIVGIADPCNGLELYILFIAFLIIIPASVVKTLIYSILGSIIIYVGNIGRCYFIALMNLSATNLVEVAHHYVFKIIMYAIIFGIWVLYLRNKQWSNELVATK
jgi:exosortase/archaeosortase family protein